MSEMYIYRNECRCSHAKESHYEKQYGCLAARCDCTKYDNAFKASVTQGLTLAPDAPYPTNPSTSGWHNDVHYYDDDGIEYGPPPPSY